MNIATASSVAGSEVVFPMYQGIIDLKYGLYLHVQLLMQSLLPSMFEKVTLEAGS